jgi:transposase
MLIKTILNKTYPVKGFIYGKVNLQNNTIFVKVNSRKRSRAQCSCCHRKSLPTENHLKERAFKFVPFWGLNVNLLYAPRRVKCPRCGIKVEYIPWAQGKRLIAKPFRLFLAHWAKLLSWKEVAKQFRES